MHEKTHSHGSCCMTGDKAEAFIVFKNAYQGVDTGIVVWTQPAKAIFQKDRELIRKSDQSCRQDYKSQSFFPAEGFENKIEKQQVQRNPAQLIGCQQPKLIPGLCTQAVELNHELFVKANDFIEKAQFRDSF